MKKWWTNLLIKLGFLSPCCQAPTEYNEGWGQTYCSKCHKRL